MSYITVQTRDREMSTDPCPQNAFLLLLDIVIIINFVESLNVHLAAV